MLNSIEVNAERLNLVFPKFSEEPVAIPFFKESKAKVTCPPPRMVAVMSWNRFSATRLFSLAKRIMEMREGGALSSAKSVLNTICFGVADINEPDARSLLVKKIMSCDLVLADGQSKWPGMVEPSHRDTEMFRIFALAPDRVIKEIYEPFPAKSP